MRDGLVSVIVPTKNSGRFLEACLRSIKEQSYKEIELIVVDNFSTDNTREIAERYADKFFERGPERSAQRNYGVSMASGNFVFIIDSDMELSEGVVSSCVKEMTSGDGIVAVVVPEESFGEGFWAACKRLERSFYIGVPWMEAARFFRTETFNKLGGYDEEITGPEDWDLPQRAEQYGRISRVNDFIFHNEGKISLLKTIKKKFYYASKMSAYTRKPQHRDKIKKQMGVITRYRLILSRPKLLLANPLVGLGMLLMKTCEFLFGGMGYLFARNEKLEQSDPVDTNQVGVVSLSNYQPLVSVIIACKNNEEYIEQSIKSVFAQTYKNIELVIVDNFSSDKTFDIAKRYTSKAYQLGPERSTQFNYGFSKSEGELIYRIGAEFVLEPDVIEKCVVKIAEGFDAVATHNASRGDSIWAKVRYLERESYRNDDLIVAARFMKRNVFESVGMFDENLVAGEDFDLHNRIVEAGYKWCHADAVEYHLGEPKNIREVWRKFYYYGRTINRYRKKNKAVSKSQLVFFRPSFKRINIELLKKPKLFITFYFYLLVKHLAGAAGMIKGAPHNLSKRNI